MSAEIYTEIQAYISRLAQREGYRMVVNKSAQDRNGLPIFTYVYDRRDLTSDIIKALNETRPEVQPSTTEDDAAAVTEVLGEVDNLQDVLPEGVAPAAQE